MRRRVGEELCAEILETVVDECSALVVEEVLGAEAAAKMRGEEEARRLKADEERRVKQQVGDELAAEILEAVAHMESRVLVEEELEERERERAQREEKKAKEGVKEEVKEEVKEAKEVPEFTDSNQKSIGKIVRDTCSSLGTDFLSTRKRAFAANHEHSR